MRAEPKKKKLALAHLQVDCCVTLYGSIDPMRKRKRKMHKTHTQRGRKRERQSDFMCYVRTHWNHTAAKETTELYDNNIK